jgi:pimeloyl-ACP methyl ester carboxylesterase
VTASAQRPVAGTITLSAPDVFEGADAVTAAPSLTAPILLVAAENDTPYPSDAATIDAAATVPSEVVILSGSEHGTNLFIDHGDDLTAMILRFLSKSG